MKHVDAAEASELPRQPGQRWTVEDRAAALRAYFSTGSRRKARKATGVPERTLSSWLTDDRYERERLAVQEGLLRAVKQDSAVRGAELVEATKEAVLVCRKALRGDPDGRTASSLLTALCRARETEDRISRLDEGAATEIHGRQLAEEERVAFEAWCADRQARASRTIEELDAEIRAAFVASLRESMARRDAESVLPIVRVLVEQGDVLACWTRTDPGLARRLHALGLRCLQQVQADEESGTRPPPLPLLRATSWIDQQQERS